MAPIAGHVGDGELLCTQLSYLFMVCHEGNFHALVLYRDDAELALAQEAVSRINRKAIELEGTCKCYYLGHVNLHNVMTQVPGNTALVRVNAIIL